MRYGFRNTFNSFEIKLEKDTYNKLYVGLYVTTSDVEEGYSLNYKGISGLKITLLKSTKAFVIGNGTSNGTRSNALTVDWDGHVVATSAKKSIMYTGEYIMLYGNQSDVSVSAGQVALSTTAKNCLPSGKYLTSKSPLADDLFSVSSGKITLLKGGRYRVSGQIYLYNGFTANDSIYCSILSNDTAANVRASRYRTPTATPYTSISTETVIYYAGGGNTITLTSSNSEAARGKIGINGYTRLTIECLGIYE